MKKLYPKMNSYNTALIIIDVINSCASEKCELKNKGITFSKIRKMVPSLELFIEKYRENVNNNIIFTNTVPWKKEFLADNINELYTDANAVCYSKDNSGFAEDFFRIKPQSKDIVFTKNTNDAFADGKLNKILTKRGIKYLVITGIFGDGCIMATINGAFSCGYNLVILENLIETTDTKMRQEILGNLKKYTWPIMYGRTLTSNRFLNYWKREKTNQGKTSKNHRD